MVESELLSILKEKYIDDLKKNDDEYDTTDCYSEKFKTTFELKCRYKHYQTQMIEKDKWERMMKIKGQRLRYICQTPEGCWSFDIRKLPEPKWEIWMLPNQSHDEIKQIPKPVGFFNINDGKIIKI